jgi:hypothetical protein
MLQLELDFDDGLIDEEERQAREEVLLERLAMSQSDYDHVAEEADDG